MENILPNQDEPLKKERSYVKSITAGLRLPLRHPWGFLRQLWPLLILNMAVWAIASRWMSLSCWSAFTFCMIQDIEPSLLIFALVELACWCLLAAVLWGLLVGQVAHLMAKYDELGYLPAVAPWKVWRNILPSAIKGLLISIIGYGVTLALVAISLFAMPTRLWALVLAIILVLVWILLYTPMAEQYLMGHKKITSALLYPFRHFGSMGNSTAVVVVCGLIVGAVCFIGLIPSIIVTHVEGLSWQSVMIGEGTDIPNSFHLMVAICYALSALVNFVAWIFMIVPLTYQWGSQQHENNA